MSTQTQNSNGSAGATPVHVEPEFGTQDDTDVHEKLRKMEAVHAELIRVCQAAAKGDLEPRILHIESFGEAGEVCNNINNLLDLTDAYIRESVASMDAAREGRYYRRFFAHGLLGAFGAGAGSIDEARRTIKDMSEAAVQQRITVADEFEAQTSDVLSAVVGSLEQLNMTSDQMGQAASSTLDLAKILKSETETADGSVTNVASATEELSCAIAEVTERSAEVRNQSVEALAASRNASDIIGELSDSTRDIMKVVDLINHVAGQTRLLALNATIEAARAGDAGRGFAVVASEVKGLAAQTATATETITANIDSMVSNVDSAVTVITKVTKANQETEEHVTSVASATEEQNAATADISRSMQIASDSVTNVAEVVIDVEKSANQVGDASNEVSETVDNLSKRIDDLNKAVQHFTRYLREGK